MNIKSKFGYLCCASLLTTSLWAQDVLISTRNTSLLLDAPVGGEVRFIYYGDKLSTSDAATLLETEQKTFSAYPVYGLNCPSESALSVTHGDGNMTLQLEVIKVDTRKEQTADITTIRLKDKVYPFYMNLCYRTYPDADIIETWTEITHEEKKAITLNRFASAYLPIRKGDVWVSHLYGSWANEAQLAQEPLRPGIKMIKNKDGIRNSHTAHAEVMISLDGKPKENTGSVIGAALCYSGNYKLFFDTDDSDYHHFFAGINEENSAYTLKAKESFRTPELALTYSKDGLSGSSRNFHAWARKHKIANGATARKILLNSWEGVYFDINQEGMDQMMSDIQSMGGELFVMDDGWFGDKYPRNKDNSSLGDWMVDARKLPRGIEGLIADYKTIRPVVQFGDIYRLVSPYDRLGVASLMYTSPEKDKAVFYWWKTEHFVNQHLPRVKMNGLSPDKKYRVCELNRIDNEPLAFEGKAFTGEYLMANGLEIPYNHIVDYHKQNDYSSRVLYLEEVK